MSGVSVLDRRRRAVFLDRDGVINRRRPDHVKSWSEFEFLPGALTALAMLRREGWRTVIVTNQAVVGRGVLREAQLQAIHASMTRAVWLAGGHIEAIYVCMHTPESQCPCRKPAIGLFTRASAELNISLADSIMVGDSLTDIQAARRAGCRPILVADGDGLAPGEDVSVVVDLLGVIGLINDSRVHEVA